VRAPHRGATEAPGAPEGGYQAPLRGVPLKVNFLMTSFWIMKHYNFNIIAVKVQAFSGSNMV